MPFEPAVHHGILHNFSRRLVAFEHRPQRSAEDINQLETKNIILFLGGLSDGLLTVRYPSFLVKKLPGNWRLVELILGSSYTGWATSSLDEDAVQLAKAVAYFRNTYKGGKIILLGHSTGSQVMMEYTVGPWKTGPNVPETTLMRPPVDGLILQAGVSDRQGVEDALPKQVILECSSMAKEWVDSGRGSDILPSYVTRDIFGNNPSAKRWLSLVQPMGEDDYFSSDLPDSVLQRTFGAVGRRKIPILVLLSAKDEHMPSVVDKKELIGKWEDVIKANGGIYDEDSGVIPKASHNLNRSDVSTVADMCSRIIRFLERIDQKRRNIKPARLKL